jgi:hypothetical protein
MLIHDSFTRADFDHRGPILIGAITAASSRNNIRDVIGPGAMVPCVTEHKRVRHVHLLLPIQLELNERLAGHCSNGNVVIEQERANVHIEGFIFVKTPDEFQRIVQIPQSGFSRRVCFDCFCEFDGLVPRSFDKPHRRGTHNSSSRRAVVLRRPQL